MYREVCQLALHEVNSNALDGDNTTSMPFPTRKQQFAITVDCRGSAEATLAVYNE